RTPPLDEAPGSEGRAASHRAAVFGGVQDIHVPASFKVAVPDVEVAVDALDRRVAAAELAAVEGVVVVVELREGHAPPALLEKAVLEGGLRQRLRAGGVLQDTGIREAAEGEMAVRDLRLEAFV